MLIAGEVHTGLLRGSDPVTADRARRLVDLVVGEPVLVSHRPMAYVRSPEIPVGVDCGIGGAGAGRRVRGVGTALQRAAITGGHVVQGSAATTLVRAGGSTRQPWSHYLTRPGVIETLGRTRWDEVAEALTGTDRPGPTLDLGAMAGRVADRVQRAAPRGGPAPLRASRTRLRWTARPGEQPLVRFSVRADDLRLLELSVPAEPAGLAGELTALAEDVALHDWLLSTLLELVGKSALGVVDRQAALQRLVPAIDYLLHLWMPGARGGEISAAVWASLDRRPGFSRQWQTLVHRIRDQLSAGAVAALAAAGPR
ncbi:SCO2521 family protein [Actinoplanes sp. NPDC049599]|uniref:SCO2521 family protein n=1 Tax=Actinoplanes sp. NPDC049599 TaxID=3363903 RepID=UPI0037B7103B